MKYYGEYVCVDEKYEVTLLRVTNNIYPIDQRFKMNKLMFVDVDGVLNNRATLSAGTSCWLLDPNCLLLLKDIVDKTGAKIVISSTWRCFEKGLVTLKQHFRKHNIPNWIGCTEDLNN